MSDKHWNEIQKREQSVLKKVKAEEESEKRMREEFERIQAIDENTRQIARESANLNYEQEKWGRMREASKLVIEVLESVRQNSSLIKQGNQSRVILEEQSGRYDDSSKPKFYVSGGLGSRGGYASHEIQYYRIKHTLEWGQKLELSDNDKSFISSINDSLSGQIKTIFAPERILKYDKFQINVYFIPFRV